MIGVAGAIVGSVSTIAAQFVSHCLQERSRKNNEKPKKQLLEKMLRSEKHTWRKLETLMHVIGTDEENTKRLLLSLGARASEDGKNLWGLIERNPLPDSEA